MATSVTSSVSGNVTTYVITDQKGNTMTLAATAPQAGGGITASSSGGLLVDGQVVAQTLWTMLATGLRPNVMVNTNASFTN